MLLKLRARTPVMESRGSSSFVVVVMARVYHGSETYRMSRDGLAPH